MILACTVFAWSTRVTDGRTDGRTELRWLRRAIAVPAVARKNHTYPWAMTIQHAVSLYIVLWKDYCLPIKVKANDVLSIRLMFLSLRTRRTSKRILIYTATCFTSTNITGRWRNIPIKTLEVDFWNDHRKFQTTRGNFAKQAASQPHVTRTCVWLQPEPPSTLFTMSTLTWIASTNLLCARL